MSSSSRCHHRPSAQPKKTRWHRRVDMGLPFPNFALGKTEIPAVCRCIYDGRNFYVTNHFDMHTLHYNGAFGTSNLTFRGPSYDNTGYTQKPYYRKKCGGGEDNSSEAMPNGISGGSSLKFIKANATKRIRVDLESSGPELCVHISQEPAAAGLIATDNEEEINKDEKKGRRRTISDMSVDEDESVTRSKNQNCFRGNVEDENSSQVFGARQSGSGPFKAMPKPDTHLLEEEKLILMPEEAIFLSFGVGCLAIYNAQGQTVDYRQCWKNLVTANPNFPTQYAVYHYYRGKNWVPKTGNSYGAPYVLYEGGPQVNHATYIVHIIESSKPKPTWLELTAWQRLATHLAKQLLLCEVSVPKEFRPEMSEPRSVFDMRLNEMSLCRWMPRVDFQIS